MKIEKRLRELAEKNNNYSMLLAQWEFDKRLLTQALTSIARDFPHYSLHDVSHSNTLIIQIEKVIKPNIDKLSATDCWLILESCYWHDCGMIITNEEKEKLIKDPDFLSYLKKLVQTNHELALYAEKLLISQDINDLQNILNSSSALTFIFADYYRSKHAMRSGEFVKSPQQISIPSPRTSLIPKRLFAIISEISACHGKSPESMLLLPKIADGMDSDDYAHPRYIAALLRIGDLLDIDDGRFCPTLLANIGKVPNSSHHHQEKHSSIKRICITSELIEIEAECETYDGYYAQQSWFSYIENEFNYQKRVWNEIIPNYDYVALPTLGKISCSIQDYITFDNCPPQIRLNDRVYSYISSQLIYDDEYVYLREIIQNSIDATYLKVWEVFEHNNKNCFELNSPKARNLFEQQLKNETIDIFVNKTSIENDTINYEIKIKDNGIGISLDDIKKILNIGSPSFTASKKQKILDTMPDWAIPSGCFGIGLHSVFEMCRDVVIKSKQYDNQGVILKVDKRKNQLPTFFIEKFNDSWFSGTEITFTIQQEGHSISIKNFGNVHDILLNTDPLIDKEIPIIAEYVAGYIQENFSHSLVKIQLNGSSLFSDNNNDNDKKDDADPFIMDINSGIDFSLEIKLEHNKDSFFYYKGMKCNNFINVPGIYGDFNLFSKDAQYWLTMNRKKILHTRYDELLNSISEAIGRQHEIIYKSSDNKPETALYLNYIHNCHYQDWKDYLICGKLKLENVLISEAPLNILPYDATGRIKSDCGVFISTGSFLFELLGILVKKEEREFFFESNKIINAEDIIWGGIGEDILSYTVTFKKSEQLIDLDIIKYEVKSFWHNYYCYIRNAIPFLYHRDISCFPYSRRFIPCYKLSYRKISISKKNIPSMCLEFTNLGPWFDDFLFLPMAKPKEEERTINQELNIIYDFYKSQKIVKDNLSEDDFKRMYKDMWYEIGMIDESDRLITL